MLPTDFLAAPAGRHAHQDVALPRAEPRTGRAGPGSPDRLGQRWIQIGAALPHAANGQCEAFSSRAAGEIPAGLRLRPPAKVRGLAFRVEQEEGTARPT